MNPLYDREYARSMSEANGISTLGIVSLVTSIIFFAVVSLICGIIALNKIKETDRLVKNSVIESKINTGRTCAVIGIVISGIRIGLFVLIIFFAALE